MLVIAATPYGGFLSYLSNINMMIGIEKLKKSCYFIYLYTKRVRYNYKIIFVTALAFQFLISLIIKFSNVKCIALKESYFQATMF